MRVLTSGSWGAQQGHVHTGLAWPGVDVGRDDLQCANMSVACR